MSVITDVNIKQVEFRDNVRDFFPQDVRKAGFSLVKRGGGRGGGGKKEKKERGLDHTPPIPP